MPRKGRNPQVNGYLYYYDEPRPAPGISWRLLHDLCSVTAWCLRLAALVVLWDLWATWH
ncbi:hypothetical protein [Actinomadura macra]|uniref:hypothetical protein n=1 Tax=Actinomadura macra TaxID=46164 RepID=UPI000A56E708|nr:hypothetical protein [Actinomadura macra]